MARCGVAGFTGVADWTWSIRSVIQLCGVPCGARGSLSPTFAINIINLGVWLGRHIR